MFDFEAKKVYTKKVQIERILLGDDDSVGMIINDGKHRYKSCVLSERAKQKLNTNNIKEGDVIEIDFRIEI